MRAEEVRAHVRKQPFIPFRVHMSDGSSYDVGHPEFILVSMREVIVAILPRRGDMPERKVFLDPIHITRIEPIHRKRRSATG